MDMYQHDSPSDFRFVLHGELTNAAAQQLQWAWETAKSILNGKQLIIEVSGVTKADCAGIDLLIRMRESGARITVARQPECQELVQVVDISAAAPSGKSGKLAWVVRILKAARVST